MSSATKVYAIVGHPVGQARSPAVFNALFAAKWIEAVMVPLDVAPSGLADLLAGLRLCGNFAGVVVTVPHKMQAAELAVLASPRVRALGAANVLRPHPEGWEAELLDGIGFVNGLESQGFSVSGWRVAVVGAGGAGLAIAEALLGHGARVSISDMDAARVRDAVRRLGVLYGGAIEGGWPGKGHDLAVNATPVGMGDDRNLPFDPSVLSASCVVAEAVMKPPRTALIEAAAARGLRVVEGRHMLDGQVRPICEFFGIGG